MCLLVAGDMLCAEDTEWLLPGLRRTYMMMTTTVANTGGQVNFTGCGWVVGRHVQCDLQGACYVSVVLLVLL